MVAAMFAIGSCTGLLGGAYLVSALSQFYYIFWIVGPICAIVSIAFFCTLAKVSPRNLKKWTLDFKENEISPKKFVKDLFIRIKAIDLGGALLVTLGTGLFLIGLSLVRTYLQI